MKEIIAGLNKNFENRVRLGIMSALMVNDVLDFNALKDLLGVTDGNLASHLKALETNELINVSKKFVGRKPNTTYSVTEYGKLSFKKHLAALEQLLGNT
ncbi:winged helix-turn-helix domain-containing protein [Carboxylicivirga caseinilyticus]|uniref:winged helix-turn-helix domain-containing protein n=1 Tax=Carboxylicivirga caseinilyticus TaxID=3417572 RepID=UPI003D32E1DD|nr:transcriptional regulator [Marinilabiliaceae bacterium A049]